MAEMVSISDIRFLQEEIGDINRDGCNSVFIKDLQNCLKIIISLKDTISGQIESPDTFSFAEKYLELLESYQTDIKLMDDIVNWIRNGVAVENKEPAIAMLQANLTELEELCSDITENIQTQRNIVAALKANLKKPENTKVIQEKIKNKIRNTLSDLVESDKNKANTRSIIDSINELINFIEDIPMDTAMDTAMDTKEALNHFEVLRTHYTSTKLPELKEKICNVLGGFEVSLRNWDANRRGGKRKRPSKSKNRNSKHTSKRKSKRKSKRTKRR